MRYIVIIFLSNVPASACEAYQTAYQLFLLAVGRDGSISDDEY